MDGYITSQHTKWETEINTSTLHEDYIDFSQKQGIRYRLAQSTFGKELKILTPGLQRGRAAKGRSRQYVYRISSLEACRQHYDRLTMGTNDWQNDDL